MLRLLPSACLLSTMVLAAAARAERLPPIYTAKSELHVRVPEPLVEPMPTPPKPPEPETVDRMHAMSLEDFHCMALANNPTLTKAAAAVEAARGNWVQAGLYPNPNIAYLGTQIGDQGTAGQQGGYVEQEFVRGHKLRLNRSVAAREVGIAQREFAAQRMRVLNDVRIRFYDTLVAQRMLELSDDLLNVASRAQGAADDLFNAKEVSRVDVLQARVEVSNARIALGNSRNRHEAAWRRLVAVVGVPGLGEAPLSGDLVADMPTFSWEESIDRILYESPELAATRAGVDRAAAALRRARVEPVPNVTVQAGPQYDNNARGPVANANVIMAVPIFNYNQGNVRRAEAELRSARAEVARKELELTTRLATALERYSNARNQVTQYREEILPNAKEALDLVAVGYRQGEISYLSLLTTQRTYFQTNLAYLEALRELWEGSVAIDGLMLTDSLQAAGDTPASATPVISAPPPLFPFSGR